MPTNTDSPTYDFLDADSQQAITTETVRVEPSSRLMTLAGGVLAGALVFVVLGAGSATNPPAIVDSPPLQSAAPVVSGPIADRAEINRFSTLQDLHWEHRVQSWSRAEANRFTQLSELGADDGEQDGGTTP